MISGLLFHAAHCLIIGLLGLIPPICWNLVQVQATTQALLSLVPTLATPGMVLIIANPAPTPKPSKPFTAAIP